MAELLAKDFVLQAIDTGKQTNAQKIVDRVRGKDDGGGIPWMVVLDSDGKRLVTSDGPKGNIGCPIQPHEVAWFRSMLEKTRKQLTDAELDAIEAANEAYAKKYRRPPPPAPKDGG